MINLIFNKNKILKIKRLLLKNRFFHNKIKMMKIKKKVFKKMNFSFKVMNLIMNKIIKKQKIKYTNKNLESTHHKAIKQILI